jgi:hypothetical protein
MTNLIKIQDEVNSQLANREVMNALVRTVFKGLTEPVVKQAIVEGMMRGFTFEDFLKKNVYAVGFGGGYTLITSIDYARKIGQKSGVNGKSKPKYVEENGKIKSCEITIYKKDGHPDGYTAEVYFDEFTTTRNLWATKPHTMIAKVAEMHALRMACPEEMSQIYGEEEVQKEVIVAEKVITPELREKVINAKTLEELKTVYKANEGLGKDFAKLVTSKKKELTPKKDATA